MSSSNQIPAVAIAAPPGQSSKCFSYNRTEHRWLPRKAGSNVSSKIRILKLETTNDTASSTALQGSLSWVEIPSSNEFTALSYVWGTGEKTSHIIISGEKLAITSSLELALRRIISTSAQLYPENLENGLCLWIDQICINQSDMEEKAEQIVMMNHIYNAAKKVLVWIGDAADDSDLFLNLFKRIGEWADTWHMLDYYTSEKIQSLFAITRNENADDPLTRAYHEYCEKVLPEFNKPLLKAMWRWQKRSWFTRVWVVQEFALAHAPVLLCGEVAIPAHQMMLARQIFSSTIAGKLADRCVELCGGGSENISQEFRKFLTALMEDKMRVIEDMEIFSQEHKMKSDEKIEELKTQLERLVTNAEIEVFAMSEVASTLIQKRQAMQDSWLKIVGMASQDPLQSFHLARKRREKFEAGTGEGDNLYRLIQTLYVSNDMQATVARDKIYGLLGLAVDGTELGISVSYQKDLSVDVIYARTAKAVIKKGGTGLLNSVQPVGVQQKWEKDQMLPSWVPDWRKNLRQSFEERAWDSITGKENPSLFAAGGEGCLVEVVNHEDELVLGLMGLKVDVVETVANPGSKYGTGTTETIIEQDSEADPDLRDESSNIDDDIETMGWANEDTVNAIGVINYEVTLQLLESLQEICSYTRSEQDSIHNSNSARGQDYLAEACWRVPIGDIERTTHNRDIRATPSFIEAYKNCLISLHWFAREHSLPKSKQRHNLEYIMALEPSAGLYRLALDKMAGKTPFRTTDGYVGMGPLGMEKDDVVVVFDGAPIPFVLRPAEEKSWRLVGECFCYGIMDGEGLSRGDKELFNLC